MPKLNPNTLKKLNLYKTNPDLVKDVSANELADLVIVLLNSINFVENSIASGQADISGAMTKQVNALFTEYKTDSQNIKAELKSAISGSKQQIKEDGDNAKSELKKALQRLNERVSALTNGDNGVVTEAEVQRAAQMALGMLELPDFAEMVSTSIQSDGEAIRNALELLVGEERYAVEIVDVKGLEDRLKQLAVTSQGSPGGTSKPAVYRFIRDAIADGIIGGGSSLPDQSGNNGKFLSTDGTDASWETVSAGSVDVVSNVATDRILGRTTAGTGDSEQLTASEVRTLINVEDDSDKTDTANVTSAGALMDSEATDLAALKAIDQSLVNGASPVFATTNMTDASNKRFVTDAQEAKVDHITVTQAVNLDDMETDIAALANGMVYKGDWDASAGTFPGAAAAQIGWFYYVSVAGTVDSVSFAVGDNIIAVVDDASTSTYASNWSKHDQTDAVQAVVGLTGSVAKGSLLAALNVEDGADVTDTANVTSAGALMDSEVTNLSQVKAFDSTDYATSAQGSTADSALQPADIASGSITPRADDIDFSGGSDGHVMTVQSDGSMAPEALPSGTTVDLVSNVATARIIGRTTAGSGDSEELTAAAARTLLNVADGATADQDLSGKANLASPTFTGTVAGITATMVGLGNVVNISNATERLLVATLENKRIKPRVSSSASGDITPTKVDFDRYIRTAQAAAITISNPTMDIGEVMAVQLTDNATARAITFGTHYMALDGLALPTTTTISKIMTMVLEKVTATKVLVSYVEEA